MGRGKTKMTDLAHLNLQDIEVDLQEDIDVDL